VLTRGISYLRGRGSRKFGGWLVPLSGKRDQAKHTVAQPFGESLYREIYRYIPLSQDSREVMATLAFDKSTKVANRLLGIRKPPPSSSQ
jgi:hypothetical protein